ncbi:hypothetical protein ACFLX5_01600 [Chloroflexota bacterium]
MTVMWTVFIPDYLAAYCVSREGQGEARASFSLQIAAAGVKLVVGERREPLEAASDDL